MARPRWWESTPGKQSGEPCFTGTRLPVATVRALLFDRGKTPEEVQEMYPFLSLDSIQRVKP